MQARLLVAVSIFLSLLCSTALLAQEKSGSIEIESKPDSIVKVFALKSSDAQQVKKVIDELFGEQTPEQISIRSSVDERSNSIVVAGPVADVQMLESLIERLDQQLPTMRTWVVRLQNAAAIDTADAINQWLAERNKSLQSGEGKAAGQCTVLADAASNSLIVTAPVDPEFHAEISALIDSLDRRPPMIMLNVTLKQTIDGQEKVLCRPQIVTLENLQGTVSIGNAADNFTLEVTPRLVTTTDPPDHQGMPLKLPSRQ